MWRKKLHKSGTRHSANGKWSKSNRWRSNKVRHLLMRPYVSLWCFLQLQKNNKLRWLWMKVIKIPLSMCFNKTYVVTESVSGLINDSTEVSLASLQSWTVQKRPGIWHYIKKMCRLSSLAVCFSETKWEHSMSLKKVEQLLQFSLMAQHV